MLQYLPFGKEGQTEAKAEKQATSPESSQIGAIGMWRKKCRFINSSLKMQERSKEGLLKILKSYRNLQKSAPKVSEDDLNDFESNSELSEDSFKSFKNALKREIKPKDFSEDFNKDQLETE